jgi:hypothetical protein
VWVLVCLLSLLFTTLNLLPSMATTASAKLCHLTTQAEEFPTGSFNRFAVIYCAISDSFKVRCQASQQPHQLNITIGFSFQPTG